MSEPFDQALYDAVMADKMDHTSGNPSLATEYSDGYNSGYNHAALTAARRRAERAPVSDPSDEALAKIAYYAGAATYLPDDLRDQLSWSVLSKAIQESHIRAIRAVRAAIGPQVPVIPEGWQWVWMQAFWNPTKPDGQNEHYEVKLERISGRDSSTTWKRVDGTGPTWIDALTAAIEAAREVEP